MSFGRFLWQGDCTVVDQRWVPLVQTSFCVPGGTKVMKIRLIIGMALLAIAVIGFGSVAKADTFTVDTLIGAIASANSGQAYEEQQLELACSCSVTLLTN